MAIILSEEDRVRRELVRTKRLEKEGLRRKEETMPYLKEGVRKAARPKGKKARKKEHDGDGDCRQCKKTKTPRGWTTGRSHLHGMQEVHTSRVGQVMAIIAISHRGPVGHQDVHLSIAGDVFPFTADF